MNPKNLSWPDRILDGFERMAVTPWNLRAAFVADTGMCLGLVALGVVDEDTRLLLAVLAFVGGLLFFSLIEYCFHRWLFHGPDQAMQRGHQQHHRDPMGIGTLPFFLPPVFLIGALALTRVMAGLLFNVSTIDMATFSVVPMVLVLTATLAVLIPAMRATRVDPVVALRDE